MHNSVSRNGQGYYKVGIHVATDMTNVVLSGISKLTFSEMDDWREGQVASGEDEVSI